MRNSWKLWTTIGAGLLVVAGPSVTTAAAADVPSPQGGTASDAPQNAYNPGPQAEGGQAAKDSMGGPQTPAGTQDAPSHAPRYAPTGQQVTTPDYESGPADGTTQAGPSALPPQRADKQAPAPAGGPKMPSAGGEGSDLNMPNVTAPGQGPAGPAN